MKKIIFFFLLIVVGHHLTAQENQVVLGESPDTAYIRVKEVDPGMIHIKIESAANVDSITFRIMTGGIGKEKIFSPDINVWRKDDSSSVIDQTFRVWSSQDKSGQVGYNLIFWNKFGNTNIWIPERKK